MVNELDGKQLTPTDVIFVSTVTYFMNGLAIWFAQTFIFHLNFIKISCVDSKKFQFQKCRPYLISHFDI